MANTIEAFLVGFMVLVTVSAMLGIIAVFIIEPWIFVTLLVMFVLSYPIGVAIQYKQTR